VVFARLCAHLELFTGCHIKTLHTDGGGEYTSHLMADYLADMGILHQTSCPTSLQQNRVAERFQRTLFDRIRCMLAEADMSGAGGGRRHQRPYTCTIVPLLLLCLQMTLPCLFGPMNLSLSPISVSLAQHALRSTDPRIERSLRYAQLSAVCLVMTSRVRHINADQGLNKDCLVVQCYLS
jgi:transposase InsO family protein